MQSPQSEPAQTAPDDRLAARVPGGAPLGIDATENAELTKIWLQVQEKVSQLAAREGKQVKNGLDVDDVIANLDASQEKKEESTTRKAVKTAFGRTMGLIKTVGGIVADGASTVSDYSSLAIIFG
jgi:ABC-type molybdate transport system substrate-binding protein